MQVAAAIAAASAVPSVGYNPKDGMALAQLEQAVYCGEDRFERWHVGNQTYSVDKGKVHYVTGVHGNDTLVAAGVGSMTSPDGCFVAIQGTRGTVQSIEDADFITKHWDRPNCAKCWVHSGWAKGYESIRKKLFGALDVFDCQHRPLYITGHSLGAAMVHFLLYDAIEANFTIAHVTAMESPRPGDNGFASALQEKIKNGRVGSAYRITHYHDVVVHLPPRDTPAATALPYQHYSHALPEIYYGAHTGTAYEDCGLSDASMKCANQWWEPWLLTSADHCWYADINPCSCAAATEKANITNEASATVIV